MEDDKLRSGGLLAYDEKTETWYVSMRDAHRLLVNRETLEGLLSLYNSIHSGSPLVLKDARSVVHMEEANLRMSQAIRDLHAYIDGERRSRSRGILARFVTAIRRRIFGRA